MTAAKSPVLAWSGGKDSTFLLLLAREMGYNLPCLVFSHFWTRNQLEYIKKIVEKHSVTAFFYRPTSLRYNSNSLVAYYKVGGKEMPVIFDHVHDDSRCGIELGQKALQGPEAMYLWDVTILGSKKGDSHPLVPSLDFSSFDSATRIETPLWHWTDEEVLQKMEDFGFEPPVTDDSHDTGNFIACMNCQSSGEVYCPKLNKTIQGFGD